MNRRDERADVWFPPQILAQQFNVRQITMSNFSVNPEHYKIPLSNNGDEPILNDCVQLVMCNTLYKGDIVNACLSSPCN